MEITNEMTTPHTDKKRKKKRSRSDSENDNAPDPPEAKRLFEVTEPTDASPKEPVEIRNPPQKSSNLLCSVGKHSNVFPKPVVHLAKKFMKTHSKEDVLKMNYNSKLLDAQERTILRQNWNEFFKEHPHPQPTLLVRPKKQEEQEREQAEAFVKEHKLYKRLGKGINQHPFKIYRTIMRYFPYRTPSYFEAKKLKMKKKGKNKATQNCSIWTLSEIAMLIDVVCDVMAGEKWRAAIPFETIAERLSNKNAGNCHTLWYTQGCWMVNSKWHKREIPFSLQDRVNLVKGLIDQNVESSSEVSWKELKKTKYPECHRKDLEFYWSHLTSADEIGKNGFKSTLTSLLKNLEQELVKRAKDMQTISSKESILQKQIDRHESRLEIARKKVERAQMELESVEMSKRRTELELSYLDESMLVLQVETGEILPEVDIFGEIRLEEQTLEKRVPTKEAPTEEAPEVEAPREEAAQEKALAEGTFMERVHIKEVHIEETLEREAQAVLVNGEMGNDADTVSFDDSTLGDRSI